MIQFADLHKAFDGKTVLAGVTLDVQDGETMVIIGYSGTGKSVALKHVVGLLQPDAGDVIVDGRAVSTLDRAGLYGLRREIGFVFQFAALFDSLSVADNVALGLRRRGLSEDEIAERVQGALALVDLTGAEVRMPNVTPGTIPMPAQVPPARPIRKDEIELAERGLYIESAPSPSAPAISFMMSLPPASTPSRPP